MLPPLLGVVLVSGGCDRRERSPTAPEAAAAVGDPRQSIRLPGYVPMGTASIPLPSLSGPGTDVGWTALGTVRAGEYVRVRVSGEITIRLNPAFVDEYCQGNPLSNAAQCGRPPVTVGAEGVSGGMLVVGARIRYPDGDWVYVPLSPSPLFPGERVGAWQARADGVVEFMRTGHHWVYGGIPVFALGGSQSISMDVIGQPKLKVECTGAVSAPDGSVKQEKDRVTRGQALSCVASIDPASGTGTLTVTGWRFSGGGHTYPDDQAGDDIPRGTTWNGEMATGGTITVNADVNGNPQSASASVSVEPREDFRSKRVPVAIRAGTLADVPEAQRPRDPPRNETDFGRTIISSAVSEYNPGSNLAEVMRTIRIIDDEGPNHRMAYLQEVPMQAQAVVVIHPALARGSAFYRAQAQTSHVASGAQTCVQPNWDRYVRLVEEHEGLHGNRNSHVGAFEAALNPTAAEAVEHVVGRTDNLAAMSDEWWEILKPIDERAKALSGNEVFHSGPGGKVQFGCKFNFDVPRR